MKAITKVPNPEMQRSCIEKIKYLPNYPHYPENQDIFNNSVREDVMDTDGIFENLDINQNDFVKEEIVPDLVAYDLGLGDIPENEGNEDEENNYYSLGGDDHNDLDEDRGD